MLSFLSLGFSVALVVTLLIIRSASLHAKLSADHDLSGPQKFHARPVPRIGGLAIFLGFVLGGLAWAYRSPEMRTSVLLLVFCSLPAFASGMIEDVTKRVSPLRRMLAISAAALLGVWLLGASIHRTEIPGLDWLAAWPLGAGLLAIFVVAGVANSVNIIDGFNGLASMCSMIMLSGVAFVAYSVGDTWVAGCALLTVAATMGFFVWNYPMGLIFLGDGGAYFLGFLLAELSILLIGRNASVSPLFPLLLCAYPVVETVFSMYRRKVLRGRPMGMPDGVHLHSLIYRRLMRWAIGSRDARALTRRNSLTAPYLWVVCSLSTIPAVLWWNDSFALACALGVYAAGYVTMYWRIVRFRTPHWLVLKR
ncbi:glycosyltransferase [Paucibacter sp. PLA-PC-4]|uniref:MraY family glycosyltransferase n=1 Tax=Paucibacter sp. PLA-PC-4 TaxID=2993655 RepID=UPI00224A6D48|nr:glycosyltransferase [Paucibacter sp. PLA-PC-4]MCX2865143.1 glycosyltransferase [Paucibacter sp. PLA-PC-4]